MELKPSEELWRSSILSLDWLCTWKWFDQANESIEAAADSKEQESQKLVLLQIESGRQEVERWLERFVYSHVWQMVALVDWAMSFAEDCLVSVAGWHRGRWANELARRQAEYW